MRRLALFAQHGWYPQTEQAARALLADYLTSEETPRPARAVLVPHAGWRFSGPVAGRLYGGLLVPKRVVVLCPQHRPGGSRLALWSEGSWQTPLGDVAIDADFAAALKSRHPAICEDAEAHLDEHAIEIQLPFLLSRNPQFTLVPLRVSGLSLAACEELAQALVATIAAAGDSRDTLLVASSDLSHEASLARVLSQDAAVRERVCAFDAEGLYRLVAERDISMCGVLPAVVCWRAAALLGALAAREVAYATSYDVSGQDDYVVGYMAARAEMES